MSAHDLEPGVTMAIGVLLVIHVVGSVIITRRRNEGSQGARLAGLPNRLLVLYPAAWFLAFHILMICGLFWPVAQMNPGDTARDLHFYYVCSWPLMLLAGALAIVVLLVRLLILPFRPSSDGAWSWTLPLVGIAANLLFLLLALEDFPSA